MDKFTVIAKYRDKLVWDDDQIENCDVRSLEDLIAWFVREDCIPVAWTTERVQHHGGTKTYHTLYLEALAAGRVIDFVDGKYIPRGVEPEPICFERVEPIEGPFFIGAEEQRSLARLERLRTLEVADRNCAMRPSDEIPPAPLPVEKVGGFDAFKGWAPVISGSISQPQPLGLPSSDLQRVSHQVDYEHGSAVFALEKKG